MADQLETGLIGGVEKRDIMVVEYDSDWPSVLTRRFAHAKWIIRVVLLFLLTWSCLAPDKPAGKEEKPKGSLVSSWGVG
jgi:hypothetical protein